MGARSPVQRESVGVGSVPPPSPPAADTHCVLGLLCALGCEVVLLLGAEAQEDAPRESAEAAPAPACV